jgi:hypothetical protein
VKSKSAPSNSLLINPTLASFLLLVRILSLQSVAIMAETKKKSPKKAAAKVR